jgi:DNA-binding MarR family transcriptional regulator
MTRGDADADAPADRAADRADTLGEAFWSLARQLRGTSMQSLAQWDVTPSQARALRELTQHGVMRPSELSTHLRIAPRSTTEVVDSLESKGLVERAPDPRDRRATLVRLTSHGTTVSEGIRASRGSEAERVFDRLSVTDRAHLTRILKKLRE